jgi:hypothetical protein
MTLKAQTDRVVRLERGASRVLWTGATARVMLAAPTEPFAEEPHR